MQLAVRLGQSHPALGAAGHTPADIDLLLVSSLFPDQPGPGDAAPLAARLGLRCGAWNLEAMCVAPWIALETAAALIRAGTYRRILIATSCTYSRSVEEDDTLAFFMGDGGAALLVAYAVWMLWPALAAQLRPELVQLWYQMALNGRRDMTRLGPAGEILEPCRRIDQIHTRSRSRVTDVSIPLRNPRIERIDWTGMNSTRF